jgi:hypothetical protein
MSIFLAAYITAIVIYVAAYLDDWNRHNHRPLLTAFTGASTGAAFIFAWLDVFR